MKLAVINNSKERLICMGQLTEIEMALFSYQEKYGHFPPSHVLDKDGRPMHSWRVLLLEFLDEDLYSKYDFKQSWDGPNNSALGKRIPSCYALHDGRRPPSKPVTRFVVIEGKGLVFEGDRTTTLNHIEDPTDTILVVESLNCGIHWMAPRD